MAQSSTTRRACRLPPPERSTGVFCHAPSLFSSLGKHGPCSVHRGGKLFLYKCFLLVWYLRRKLRHIFVCAAPPLCKRRLLRRVQRPRNPYIARLAYISDRSAEPGLHSHCKYEVKQVPGKAATRKHIQSTRKELKWNVPPETKPIVEP